MGGEVSQVGRGAMGGDGSKGGGGTMAMKVALWLGGGGCHCGHKGNPRAMGVALWSWGWQCPWGCRGASLWSWGCPQGLWGGHCGQGGPHKLGRGTRHQH